MSIPTTAAWRIVAEREVREKLRSRPFRIGLAVFLLGVVALVVLNAALSGRDQTVRVAVTDDTAASVIHRAGSLAAQVDATTKLEAREYDDAEAARRAVSDGDVDAALLPGQDSDDWVLVGHDEVDRTLAAAVSGTVNPPSTDVQVGQQLLDPQAADAEKRRLVAFVLVLLFYFAALTFGIGIAQSVVEEKESRVIEILAAAVPTRAMLWGKIAGNTVLALSQIVLAVLAGAVGLLLTGKHDLLAGIGPALAWYVAFFLLGFVALSALWSAAGAMAGRLADVQSTSMPLQVLLLAGYLLGAVGGDRLEEVVSLVPVISPMVMPGRIATGDVPLWQILLALALNAVAAVLLVRLGARIYDRNLLETGRRISIREALG
ncbi:MAG TPA: ABC transporter permease [Marmoricola sp.]|nr:ABC transporter permease [Marmoricola sp.]